MGLAPDWSEHEAETRQVFIQADVNASLLMEIKGYFTLTDVCGSVVTK